MPALKNLLRYEPETGRIFWVVSKGRARAGQEAGSPTAGGYLQIRVDGTAYLAHRLAWFLHYGEWPSGRLDHSNTDRLDNRIQNLRPASPAQNAGNSKRRATNRSGFKGVAPSTSGRWVAYITVQGKSRNLGTFDTPELAHDRYMAEAGKVYGEFARGI